MSVDSITEHPIRANRRSGNLYVRMAWRNLWRNKRRSFLLITSVVIAVFIAVAFTSLQLGQNEYMIHVTVGFYTGHIQVHGKGYWEKKSLDESMALSSQQIAALEAAPHVKQVSLRFETVSLVSHSTTTKVSPVIGIDPEREDRMTGLRRRVVSGVYLAPESRGAMLAEGLARLLHVAVGDSVVVYGQGYRGVTAAMIVPVEGIVKFPLPDLNNTMVYLSLTFAQQLYSAEGRLTAAAVLLDNHEFLNETAAILKKDVDSTKEVMTYEELMPELVQGIDANNGGTVLMLLILYVVIGFGIFGTVMMMTVERTREFGILVSIGMTRWRLISVTVIESVILSVIGSIAGIVISIPPVYYFYLYPIHLTGTYAEAMLAYGFEPILPLSIDPLVFLIQGMIVFGVGIVSALYPMIVVRSLHPVRAMHS